MKWLPPLLGVLGLSLVLLLAQNSFDTPYKLSPQGCRMSWMSPSYILQSGLDAKWSRLASRYSLWLYREVGWEEASTLHGQPVLFIPGNAGSSQQVRSIASSAARQYFHSPYIVSGEFQGRNIQALDFFAVDFNEDLSALHAPTLESETSYTADAIRYILSLYPSDTKIIIIGHSMGGIVGLSLLSHPTLLAMSVNDPIKAIITLSTPHQLPPVRFDRRSEALYADHVLPALRNASTPILSICGGVTDPQIASEVCALPATAPRDNEQQPPYRRTIFTSSLEGTWTGVGHRESVWCHQVRWRVARAALELGSGLGGKALDRWFAAGPIPSGTSGGVLDLSLVRETVQLSPPDADSMPLSAKMVSSLQIFTISPSATNRMFTLMISRGSVGPVAPHHPSNLAASVFLCTLRNGADRECKPLSGSVLLIPNPALGKRFPVQDEGSDESDGVVVFESPIPSLKGKKDVEVGILLKNAEGSTQAIVGLTSDEDIDAGVGKFDLLFGGVSLSLRQGIIRQTILFPNVLQSSLLAYKVWTTQNAGGCAASLLPPLILHTSSKDEYHFFQTDRPFYIHSHTGASPYIAPTEKGGLSLTIFTSGACSIDKLHLKVDWLASFGRMGNRYWIALSQLGIAVIAVIIGSSWWSWDCGYTYPDVRTSLRVYATTTMLPISGVLFLLSFLPLSRNMLLGNVGESMFTPVAPVLWILGSGLVFATWYIIEALLFSLRLLKRVLRVSTDIYIKTERRLTKRHAVSIGLLLLLVAIFIPYHVALLICYILQLNSCSHSLADTASPSSIKLTRRTRSRSRSGSRPSSPSVSPTPTTIDLLAVYHAQNQHILLLLTWLLPFAAPVLVVWIRTLLTAGFTVPFNGDHNVLSVAFWLIYVEYASNGTGFERARAEQWKTGLTALGWALVACYAVLFGARWTFGVYECCNFMMAWLVCGRMRWF